jgi:hypothetical protein
MVKGKPIMRWLSDCSPFILFIAMRHALCSLRFDSFSWPDMETAAAFFSRFPGVSKKPETCSFKGPVVNLSSYVAHPGNFLIAQPHLLIDFLQRTGSHLDV